MKATVYFPPTSLQRDAWFASAAPQIIQAYHHNTSRRGPTVTLSDDLTDDSAASEMFDLSNNPGRQEERDEKYGEFRSVSTGDIIALDNGKAYLCKSVGWEEIKIGAYAPELARADSLLAADQLREKYSLQGDEHPQHSKQDWRSEVAFGDTLRGYWEWVEAKIEEGEM